WKDEERIAEEKVQRESERCKNRDSSPKCFSWKREVRPAGEPPSQSCDWDNEQSQARGISKRCRIIRSGLQKKRMKDTSQCNRSRNNERCRDGKHDVKRFFAFLHQDDSVNRTVLSFKFKF